MRVLLISDIHGNLPALTAVLNEAKPFDKVICLGDLAGYFPFVNEVIEIVSCLDNMVCVKGNHDYVLMDHEATTGSRSADLALAFHRKIITGSNLAFLAGLPEIIRNYDIEGSPCFIFHGSPENPLQGREAFWKGGALEEGVYFFGHSHRSVFEKDAGRRWMVINPGSCGFPRDGDPRASYAVLDTSDWRVEYFRVTYPLQVVADKCRETGLPENFSRSLKAGEWVS